ncbi:MAG: hypothetical protein J3K34DRAFT_227252 [Monoraphidium minutum]|nr:MAG: hypothetical protein J3K34DRAFT_227252 [Monoraphidium minutum]
MLRLLVMIAALAAAAASQAPSSSDCLATTQSIGENSLLLRLSACQSGASSSCCSAANGLLSGSGELGNCLCNQDVLDQTLSTIESNPLAQSSGVTGAAINQVLQECGVPLPGSPACSGGGVSVEAPGTSVDVAPGGATSVTAPGTSVNVGGGAGGGGGDDDGGAAAGAGIFKHPKLFRHGLLRHHKKHPLLG